MSEASTHTPLGPGARIRTLAPGLLLFGVVSLLGNEFGTMLRYPGVGAALFYPPYALLTAALVVTSPRDWVWYVLMSLVTHILPHWPEWTLSWVLVADAANVTRAL